MQVPRIWCVSYVCIYFATLERYTGSLIHQCRRVIGIKEFRIRDMHNTSVLQLHGRVTRVVLRLVWPFDGILQN